jgi:SAM-dependent methyltransferase
MSDTLSEFRRSRSHERVLAHYLIEKALAERLREASREERRHLYRSLYDELFRRVPDHSQLHNKAAGDVRQRYWRELALVEGLLPDDGVFLELGAGDCQFTLEIARHARHAYAVDVSTEIVTDSGAVANFELVLSDGCTVPVPPASVDLAYSNQLIEHLHPDDVRAQLRAVYAALRPGGRYVCLTPHRYTGPHDISRGFDDVATGFHLHEYTSTELCALLRDSGFVDVRQLVGAKGHYLPLWPALGAALESLLAPLPPRWQRRLGDLPGLRMALHRLMVTARRPA